ncbi:FecR family protein [Pseudobacter ginsenosidimutans]|uniref:FecR family protein n=1 Tax=Pseudobacter ginsenosidimutans TaxID=661488 RepID=A0A4Q7MV88_9BACT|nr:FecR family protein [Pseudobacter ginsenosidimutans]RZS72577.1 FecR family protein [Pseudobacter ginsenosidimutans]
MTPERIQQLLEKYLSNTASAIEEAELTQWYNSTNEHPVEWPVDHQGEPEEIKARMLRKLQAEVHSSSYPQSIPFYRKRSWQIAASVLLLLGAAAWFTLSKPATDPKETAVITATNPDPILPGGNKATLTLGDGSTILLDTAGNTLLAQEGATRIIKLDNGQLAYKDASKENTGSTTSYNTIRTPNGGQYQVVLPDGTHAWLNAASVLRFPIAFTGSERKVQLSGEAYFDVAKNPAMPFIVEATDAHGRELNTVEVLGTGFNVNAYDNEPTVKTTLVEGKVKVSNGGGSQQSVILTHSMQSIYSHDRGAAGNFRLRQVDTDDVVAWKNGLFNFNNADIKTVMRQLARWYDVEVVYEGVLPNEKFDGEISRNSTLAEVFNILELSAIHFKVEGRKVTVMP